MESCVFCKIAKREIDTQLAYEDEKFIAFKDINPQAPVHIIICPKDHIEKIDSINGKVKIWEALFSIANIMIKKFELDKTGYKIVNNGAGYNHLEHEHIHVLGGKGYKPPCDP